MKITLSKRIGLLAFLLPCALALSTTVHAETNKLVIESGDSAQSRQRAAMEKEQWNDTRNLRQKVNKRTEKEWIKPTLLLITAINVSKAPTSMPTGSQILCAAWTVELAALLSPNLLLI